MKNIILILFLTFITNFLNAQNKEVLTNKSISDLSKMNLPDATILKKMNTSKCKFDVSVDALIILKKNQVSPAIIEEMIKISEKNEQSHVANKGNSNDPNEMHKYGIYIYDESKKTLKKLDGNIISTAKIGGFGQKIAQNYSMGIAQAKEKSYLGGVTSHFPIKNNKPVFYIYFQGKENVNDDNFYFTDPITPNQFSLLELKEKNNGREIITGSQNAYGRTSGVSNKIKVHFDYEQINEGIYKIYFNEPLEPGEYCFMYTSDVPVRFFMPTQNITSSFSNENVNKVFDFSILPVYSDESQEDK